MGEIRAEIGREKGKGGGEVIRPDRKRRNETAARGEKSCGSTF